MLSKNEEDTTQCNVEAMNVSIKSYTFPTMFSTRIVYIYIYTNILLCLMFRFALPILCTQIYISL